jgi:hypothetical protein
MAKAATSGQSAPLITPGVYDQGVAQPAAQPGAPSMAVPAARGIQGAAAPAAPVQQAQDQLQAAPQQAQQAPTAGAAMPDLSESKTTVAQYQLPKNADGSTNIQEVIRPKKTADALFYQGPWQSKLRAEFERAYGVDKAMEMDAKLKTAAEAGYKQRVLEAAELQKAGDMQGVALKLNEIYNRDYVDGAFSNVRFLKDGQVEVVRFTPDGRIVDRSVQPMPDMVNAARQLLTPEERAKLIIGGGGKAGDYTILQNDAGGAVKYNKVTDEQTPIEGLRPTSMVSLDLRKDEMTARELDRAADNARADRADARAREALDKRGELTDAQKIAIKKADAEIETARATYHKWFNKRKAERAAAAPDKRKYISMTPITGTAEAKALAKAQEKKSTELE